MIKRYTINYSQKGGNSNNIWIYENFFSEKDFELITQYTKKFQLFNDPRSNNRLSTCIDFKKYKEFYNMIYKNKKFIDLIKKIKNSSLQMKEYPSFPIEYRKYFTGSKGMNWHIDTSLFQPDAFEAVLTLTNNSDSRFEWLENNELKILNPKPNDLVIVRPQSVQHMVSPVNIGERTILKFVVEFTFNNENSKKIEYFNEITKCKYS